jgi:hypothetical protein
MPRVVSLAEQVDGMSVLRTKGGASPTALQLLKNAWITSKRTIQSRPGSVEELTFPEGTVGVVGLGDKFHTFAGAPTTAPADPRVVVDILVHPETVGTPLTKIHEAFSFLGRLYVVAEFQDGRVQHYWIEDPATWTPATQMNLGSVIQPTSKTGFYYENYTLSGFFAWQAQTEMQIGQSRQPTTGNNLRYEVSAVSGTPPYKTFNTEPSWPTVIGQSVVERYYVTDGVVVNPGSSSPSPGSGVNRPPSDYSPYPNTRRQLE